MEGEERAIYYISKKFLKYQIYYMALENYPSIIRGNQEA